MKISHTNPKKSSLLPLSWQLFMKRKTVQGRGLLWLLAGMGLFLSLGSYSASDPSWNATSSNATLVHNWLGVHGAIVADMMFQSFGVSAWLAGFPLLIWGTLLVRLDNLPPRGYLLAILLGALLLLSSSMSFLSQEASIAGFIVQQTLTMLIPFNEPSYRIIMGVCMGAVGTILYAASLALTWQQWQGVGAFMLQAFRRFKELLSNINAREPSLPKAKPSFLNTALPPKATQRRAPDVGVAHVVRETTPPSTMSSSLDVIDSYEDSLAIEDNATDFSAPHERPRSYISSDFHLPSADILSDVPQEKSLNFSKTELEERAQLLKKVLDDFGVRGDIVSVRPGPVVTLYELVPAPGIKSSRIISLADDIARSMSAISARVSVIPGRNAIGIELPNESRMTVYFKDLVLDDRYNSNPHRLPLILGKDISGAPIIADLARMPHLLVAGTTGSGKSVGINAMILSLVYKLSPQACKFIMIDPKMLELSIYDGIPHLLTPVVTDPRKAVVALKWVVREMENRYRAMSQLSVRNIDGYNEKLAEAKARGEVLKRTVQVGFDNETGRPQYEDQELPSEPLPYIVVVVDEMADLMLVAGKDVEGAIQRLAQMARAAGIHLIMATQRPSVDVITGTIKANFPTRISFQVTSKIDSRTILGEGGAEQLLGQGDMLYMAAGGRMIRVHGPFVKDQDVETVVKYLRAQGAPSYISTVVDESEVGGLDSGLDSSSAEDDLFQQAVELVQRERKASTSFIQRYLKIGYNRAASIMDEMERRGLVSEANHVGKREVLMPSREAS